MNPVIAAIVTPTDGLGEYDKLPPAVKQFYSPNQWQFLGDDEKARVVQSECDPEW